MSNAVHDHCMTCSADHGVIHDAPYDSTKCYAVFGGEHAETDEYSYDWEARCLAAEGVRDAVLVENTKLRCALEPFADAAKRLPEDASITRAFEALSASLPQDLRPAAEALK